MTAVTRRALFAVPALATGKKRRRRIAMQPDQSGVFFQLVVVGGGEFTYDAAGNLRTANVGQTVTDPLQGITCYAGFDTFNGHGAVISLFSSTLNAQLWYADTGSSVQGALSQSVCPTAGGVDPFGNTFLQGICSYGPSGVTQVNATEINIGLRSDATVRATIQAADTALGFLLVQSALKTDVDVPAALTLLSKLAGSGGTQPQAVIAAAAGVAVPATTSLLEVQGQIATTSLANIVANGGLIAQTGDVTAQLGNLIANSIGKGLQIATGTNGRLIKATLAGGTVTVANTSVTANTQIFVNHISIGPNAGVLGYTLNPGVGFTINSTNAADANSVSCLLVERL